MPISVAVRSKACRRLVTGIVGSKPAEGMDVRLFCLVSIASVAASAMS
jgi:hypothetical protein